MGDMLSQAEIDALLGTDEDSVDDGFDDVVLEDSSVGSTDDIANVLTAEQRDTLGEIGNISMGTAATTLFALLNQKVLITTPVVKCVTWNAMSAMYERPCVGIRVNYKEGLKGANILILRHEDVKVISNLMMGGDGNVDTNEELTELDLSAIGEAMNQMVGSSSTSLSSMTKTKIDIDTPQAFVMDLSNDEFFDQVGFEPSEVIVSTAFRMEIGALIDSTIMQILPKDFAIDMVQKLRYDMLGDEHVPATPAPQPAPIPQAAAPAPVAPPSPPPIAPAAAPPPPPPVQQPYPPQQQAYDPAAIYAQPYPQYAPYPQQQAAAPAPPPQNVAPVHFQSFDIGSVMQQKENIGIIMDVPLEITVELGRTRKKIKEILEFTPGSIIELDKLAGEPIDILVNGKFVAKGEVVVIDENFGIRITDIIGVEERI